MRTSNIRELTGLAQDVYDTVFRGEPPAHLALRDHARGVVAVAMHRGCPLNRDPQRLIPPFGSPWIKLPPSLEQLEKKYKAGTSQAGWSLQAIFSSMTHGDFGVKVIDGYFEWSGRRRNSRRRSVQQVHDDFVAALSPSARLRFDHYVEELARNRAQIFEERLREKLGMKPEAETALAAAERNLIASLPKKLVRTFREKIRPFLDNPYLAKEAERFDLDLMRRWMLQRILQLGWTVKRFGEFDANIHDRGHNGHKPERMGKKYQWIAYDEFLARCSDNLEFDDSQSRDFPEEAKNGMWVVRYRDIDPSLLLSAMPAAPEKEIAAPVWWLPKPFEGWTSKPSPLEWLNHTKDLPAMSDLLRCKGPEDRAMLSLEGFIKWRQPEPIGQMAIQLPDRREVWVRWRSYLVRKEHFSDTIKWAQTFDFMEGDRHRSQTWYRSHLGEHYWQAGFQAGRDNLWLEAPSYQRRKWPHPLIDTGAEYVCEDATFDCSMASTVRMSIPGQFLCEAMKLRISGRGADWRDESSHLVVLDPSATSAGPGCLIADEERLLRFLDQSGLAIFWGVCGEKNIYPDESSKMETEWLGRLRFNGGYTLSQGEVTGAFHADFVTRGSRR